MLEPLTHTGVRATYAVSDTVNVIVGVNNGWNYTDVAASGSKTGEFGATYAPNKMLLVCPHRLHRQGRFERQCRGQYPGAAAVADRLRRHLQCHLGADFDPQHRRQAVIGDGSTGTDLNTHATTHQDGFAAYANYAINDNLRTSVRFEYLANHGPDDTVHPSHIVEGTATIGYSPVKNFEVRGELRYDKAQEADAIFVRGVELGIRGRPDFCE